MSRRGSAARPPGRGAPRHARRRAMRGCSIGDIVVVRVRRSDRRIGRASRSSRCRIGNGCALLDALNWIADNAASDLAYRWFCGSKMCGTCAVRMNGREVLACWEAVEPDMTIEPLRNLPVVRDLVVDRAPFDAKVAELEPWLERPDALPGLSRAAVAQGHEGRLEGARLHRLHVLLFGLSGHRTRQPHQFRRSCAAGPARPDGARPAQRSAQRFRARWRAPASSTASPATNAKRYVRRAFRSSADDRAAEGEGGVAGARHGPSSAGVPRGRRARGRVDPTP